MLQWARGSSNHKIITTITISVIKLEHTKKETLSALMTTMKPEKDETTVYFPEI